MLHLTFCLVARNVNDMLTIAILHKCVYPENVQQLFTKQDKRIM